MPTNIIVWSDLQAHPWHEDVDAGHWRKYVLGAIGFAFGCAIRTRADYLIFNGDLFESKRIRADVATSVLEAVKNYSKAASAQRIANVGNHDMYGGETTTTMLPGFVTVAKPELICGGKILVVPHHSSFAHDVPGQFNPIYTAKSWSLAITHDDIKGSDQGHSIQATEDGLDQLVLNAGRPVTIFNGHYHHRHEFKRGDTVIVNYGACMYHDWSDLDDTTGRGVCHIRLYNDGSAEWRFVNYDCPRFLSQDKASKIKTTKNDFIQTIDVNALTEDIDTLSHNNVKDVASFDPKTSVEAYLKAMGIDPNTTQGKLLYKTGVTLLREKSI